MCLKHLKPPPCHRPWKNYLPQNRSLVPKRLGTAAPCCPSLSRLKPLTCDTPAFWRIGTDTRCRRVTPDAWPGHTCGPGAQLQASAQCRCSSGRRGSSRSGQRHCHLRGRMLRSARPVAPRAPGDSWSAVLAAPGDRPPSNPHHLSVSPPSKGARFL